MISISFAYLQREAQDAAEAQRSECLSGCSRGVLHRVEEESGAVDGHADAAQFVEVRLNSVIR